MFPGGIPFVGSGEINVGSRFALPDLYALGKEKAAHSPRAASFLVALADTRSCTPCSCGDPEGDACTASISVFKDDACSEPIPLNVPLDSTFSQCINVPPGTALGSKSATLPAYLPGACQPSGGEPAGAVYAEPATALTLCCIPAPPP